MSIYEPKRIAQIRNFETIVEKKSCKDPDLAVIYHEQMEFARFHNGLVWQVSTIFVPFSLAGLALDFQNDSNKLMIIQLMFITSGSIAIIILWCALAEWHRWLWVHSFHLAKLVEYKWGYRCKPLPPLRYDITPAAPPPSFLGVEANRSDIGRMIRMMIALVVIIIWLLRFTCELLVQ
jgi:hypothetical protein